MNDILGQTLLRKNERRRWFSIIADEVTDIINSERLNISIRWVSDTNDIYEDSVGLCQVPNTSADILYTVIKDALIRCNLPISLCRGMVLLPCLAKNLVWQPDF